MFSLWGVRGQRIFVDPRSKLIMVKTAVHKQPNDPRPTLEGEALWLALVHEFGG